jgi:hypothetical protein
MWFNSGSIFLVLPLTNVGKNDIWRLHCIYCSIKWGIYQERWWQNNGDKDVQQILSNDNLADLFKKALPTTAFEKHV